MSDGCRLSLALARRRAGKPHGERMLWWRMAGVTALLSLCSINAQAACEYYYCTDTISMMIVDATGVSVRLTSGLTGLTNCTADSGVYLRLPKSDANYASHYAMLFAAKFADKAVSIRTIDGSATCAVSYMYIQ